MSELFSEDITVWNQETEGWVKRAVFLKLRNRNDWTSVVFFMDAPIARALAGLLTEYAEKLESAKVTVRGELLEGAYAVGRELGKAYYHNSMSLCTPSNNRAMELAFLSGLLGFKCDIEFFKAEAVK